MMQRTIKRFAGWASAVALSLVCLPLESEAAIIASDGGITLWISWDDLDDPWRLNGEAESIIELLSDVRAAGSWKRYVGAWRVELLLLQRLSATGRAFPRAELMERLVALPPPLVGKVASYWRTARDPLY